MNFKLEPGAVVVVPEGRLFVTLAKRPNAEDGETPWIARLRQDGDHFSFRREEDMIEEGRRDMPTGGRIAFIPANVRAGDRLVVQWVDKRCACLKRADGNVRPDLRTNTVSPPYASSL